MVPNQGQETTKNAFRQLKLSSFDGTSFFVVFVIHIWKLGRGEQVRKNTIWRLMDKVVMLFAICRCISIYFSPFFLNVHFSFQSIFLHFQQQLRSVVTIIREGNRDFCQEGFLAFSNFLILNWLEKQLFECFSAHYGPFSSQSWEKLSKWDQTSFSPLLNIFENQGHLLLCLRLTRFQQQEEEEEEWLIMAFR